MKSEKFRPLNDCMNAQQLLDELIEAKKVWGTLDVPINIFMSDGDRFPITGLDLFDDGDPDSDNPSKDRVLHSIDINLS
jgi:hypothetical protein